MKTNLNRIAIGVMLAASLCFFLLILSGCKYIGVDPTAPNKVESALFTTITNYVEVVTKREVTNQVLMPVTFYTTNEVGQIVTRTNEVMLAKYSLVDVTNVIPAYQNSVSDTTKADVQTVGGLVNYFFPGVGSMVSTGLLAILGGWAHLRSSKRGQTNVALTQEMETVREFIKQLPQGAKYDQAITTFLTQHQAEAGVIDQVLGILENQTNNAEAKAAMEQIQTALKAA